MPQINVECGKKREIENILCSQEAYAEWGEVEQKP